MTSTADPTISTATHPADRLLCKGKGRSSSEGAAKVLLESLRAQLVNTYA